MDGCHKTGAVVAGNCSGVSPAAIPPALAIRAPANNALRMFTTITLAKCQQSQCESRTASVQSRLMWKLLIVIIMLGVGAAALWVNAGRAPGPVIEIGGPEVIGQTGEISVTVTAPNAALKDFQVTLTQGGAGTPVFALTPATASELKADGDRVTVTRPMGKRVVPELKPGAAKVTASAVRPVLFGFREARSTVTRDITVRLNPPQIAVLSQFHYVNHGGSEMVVYRVTPPDSESGVRVGDYEYRGFPASGAGIPATDPGMHVAFFALLWDHP